MFSLTFGEKSQLISQGGAPPVMFVGLKTKVTTSIYLPHQPKHESWSYLHQLSDSELGHHIVYIYIHLESYPCKYLSQTK